MVNDFGNRKKKPKYIVNIKAKEKRTKQWYYKFQKGIFKQVFLSVRKKLLNKIGNNSIFWVFIADVPFQSGYEHSIPLSQAPHVDSKKHKCRWYVKQITVNTTSQITENLAGNDEKRSTVSSDSFKWKKMKKAILILGPEYFRTRKIEMWKKN